VALRLQTAESEAVDVKRLVLILAAVAAPAFAAGSFLAPTSVISSQSGSRAAHSELVRDEDVDAYGNEVTSAVAEYSLDGAGDPYELHSPQTELPRLGSPES
jgi:hypothetical protein